jgi:hypothetical protein
LYLKNYTAKFDSEYEDLILKACDTFNSNSGMNIAKVARKFGVDYYALRRRFCGIWELQIEMKLSTTPEFSSRLRPRVSGYTNLPVVRYQGW